MVQGYICRASTVAKWYILVQNCLENT